MIQYPWSSANAEYFHKVVTFLKWMLNEAESQANEKDDQNLKAKFGKMMNVEELIMNKIMEHE